jgi:hypothetical protein
MKPGAVQSDRSASDYDLSGLLAPLLCWCGPFDQRPEGR